MNRCPIVFPAWAVCCICVLAAGAPAADVAAPAAAGRTPTLYLKNGDRLAGEFQPTDSADELRWSSPIFREPVRFDLRGVSHVSYVPPPAAESAAPSRIQRRAGNPLAAQLLRLMNTLPQPPAVAPKPVPGVRLELQGDQVLFGDLVSLDAEHLTMRSARHRTVRIRRDHVLGVDGIASRASLMFDGSGNLAVWISTGKGRTTGDWQTASRTLQTTVTGASLFYRPPDPVPVLYELELAGNKVAEFQVVLGATADLSNLRQGISLEPWGDQLVLYYQTDERQIETVPLGPLPREPGGDWNLPLEIYFDPAKRHVEVHSRGKQLGQLQLKTARAPLGAGWLIRNRGEHLVVKSARLRRWLGPVRSQQQLREGDLLVMTDGTWQQGQVVALDVAQNQLVFRGEQGEQRLVLDRVDRINFRRRAAAADLPPQPAVAAPDGQDAANRGENLFVNYMDGSQLHGRYLGIDREGLRLAADFATEEILAGWENLAEVRWTSAAPAPATHPKLGLVQQDGTTVHGRIVSGDGLAELQWEPTYSQTPVPFASRVGAEVTFEPAVNDIGVSRLFSELTLTNGDTLPCDVVAIDADSVVARFAGGEEARIPRSYFKALRDSRPENWLYPGFADGDVWLSSSREPSVVRWRNGTFELFGDVLLAHEFSLPDRFRVSFDVQWHQDLDFVVGVGADTAQHAVDRPQNRGITEESLKEAMKEKPDDLIEVALMRRGQALTVRGLTRVAGILSMVFQGNAFQPNQTLGTFQLDENSVVHIDVLVDRQAREYAVLANGREMYRWRDPSRLEGNYVFFGLGTITTPSNLMQPGRSNTRPAVSVFNFRVARWPGAMPEDDLNRFLTRRVGSSKKSMTHAVRAANGDCLRGQLVELRDEHVLFQSRFETLTLPRQNVVEIITLVPDLPPANAESRLESTARLRLWGGGTATMHSLRANDELIQGQSPLVGAISLPWSAVAAIEFGGQRTGGSPFDRWVLRDPPKLPTPEESASQQATSPWLDKSAPEITLPVLDGEPIALAKLRGRPIVLDFWATWCGPCIGSMPTMMELSDEFQGRVEFFAVNQQEDPDEVRDFLKARLWKLRVGLDEDGALGRTFGVEAIPYLLVIDAEGIVRHVHVGASPDLKDKLTSVLNDLLK